MSAANKALKIYVAGKMSKDSVFGTHYWRDEFVETLEKQSGMKLVSLDPAKKNADQSKPEQAFGGDVFMISQCDVLIVYLSDDISVGGSQEILVAKYFKKPVIGLAPAGGKFNHKHKEMLGQVVENYIHPFVFSTCDVICSNIQEAADALKNFDRIKPKTIDLIKNYADKYENEVLPKDNYLQNIINGS